MDIITRVFYLSSLLLKLPQSLVKAMFLFFTHLFAKVNRAQSKHRSNTQVGEGLIILQSNDLQFNISLCSWGYDREEWCSTDRSQQVDSNYHKKSHCSI